MQRALALTLGEPAGIGPDITLKVWLRRKELGIPPFYVISDPEFLAPAITQARRRTADDGGGTAGSLRLFREQASGGSARAPGDGGARHTGCFECAVCDRSDPARGRRRPRRSSRRHGHQSGGEIGAVPQRICRARSHRVSRQTGPGNHRPRRTTGDDALVAGARGRSGHHPSSAARCRRASHHRAAGQDWPHRGARSHRKVRNTAPAPGVGWPQSARRRRRSPGSGGCRDRCSRGAAASGGTDRRARAPPRRHHVPRPRARQLTMWHFACITTRRSSRSKLWPSIMR